MPAAARIPALLILVLTLVMLVIGLNPRGFDGGNGVDWGPESRGVHFDRGIAYTTPDLDRARLDGDGAVWTWQVALRAEPREAAGFGVVAGLYSGADSGQLQIAQWRRTLVVMAGDDYPHRLRGQRLSYELGDDDDVLVLSIVRDAGGATLYVGGQAASRNPRVDWPPLGAPAPARLVLGSTVTGSYPWRGTLLGTAVYDQALTAKQVRGGFRGWESTSDTRLPRPLLAYDLGELPDRRAASTGRLATELVFPPAFVAPELRALSWPGQWWPLRRALLLDMTVNLLGFVPFGFCAAWLAGAFPGRGARLAPAVAVAAGVLLSLSIELIQVWLPTRDSSLLDLVMNGIGTGVGAAVFMLARRQRRRRYGTP